MFYSVDLTLVCLVSRDLSGSELYFLFDALGHWLGSSNCHWLPFKSALPGFHSNDWEVPWTASFYSHRHDGSHFLSAGSRFWVEILFLELKGHLWPRNVWLDKSHFFSSVLLDMFKDWTRAGVQPQRAWFLQGSRATHINNASTFLHIQLLISVLDDPGHSQLINNQFRITFLLEILQYSYEWMTSFIL